MRLLPFLGSFADELTKIAEYAPGIPSKHRSHELPKVTEPKKWEFGVHHHLADKRGEHFDLRLGDPDTGHAHSWAMKATWPKPGESSWAIQQPTHTVRYMDFTGEIPSGYGKGRVLLQDRDKTEIISSRPGHVSFNVYRSSGPPEEYSLHRIHGEKWKLFNRTPTRDTLHLPRSKPKYRDVDIHRSDRYIDDHDWVASAKLDDAHNLFLMPASGEPIRVVSYREAKRNETGLIDHTAKIPSLHGVKTPKELRGTILRGGIYAMHPETGKATDAQHIAGMLNTNVWKSREKQQRHGELIPVIYDVVQHKGKNMENAPYAEKLHVLELAAKHLPVELPRMAVTPEAKRQLIAEMKAGQIPETQEGVVFWNMAKSTPAVKAKFRKDHDVHIRGFFPGEGKYRGHAVGGFTFSHTADGPIVGRVGTGLSDDLRIDMSSNPDKYLNLVARVEAQQKFPSGALRAPAFKGWHLDKNEPEDISSVLP